MMTFLLAVPPLTTYAAACLWFYDLAKAGDIVAIFAILIHLIWICFVLTLAIEDEGGMPKNFTTVGLSSDIVGDDTFQDYIDDELEKINQRRAEAEEANGEGQLEGRPEAVVTHLEDDPLVKIKERMQKLMRQWRNVTTGTLVLTADEERARKRKIAIRFDRLCQYVKALPVGDLQPGSEEEELRVLLDVKWNRLNSGDVFINIETGEIRTPESPLSTSSPLQTQTGGPRTMSRVERFVDEIRKFKEINHIDDHHHHDGDHHSSSSDNNTEEEDHSATKISSKSSKTTNSQNTRDGENDDENASLLMNDSKKTSQMLEKASTRPWSSYKQGSGLLIICWLIALIMSILLPFDISLKMPFGLAAARGLERPLGGHGHVEAHGAHQAHQGIRMVGKNR